MHLEDEQIQRLLHGEPTASPRALLDRHVAECADCRQRVAEAERDEVLIFALLRHADHPTPAVRAESVMARARRAPSWQRWAASAALVVLGVGVAYAAPGSPVPGWVNRVAEWIAGSEEAPAAPPSAPAHPGVTSGIAVAPGTRFTIRFAAAQPTGALTVSLTDRPDIAARVLNGAATFTTTTDRLVIENVGSTADYELELPRSAAWVEVQVAQRRLLLKDGSRVLTAGPGGPDRYVLTLAEPE